MGTESNGLLARLRATVAVKGNQSDLLKWYLTHHDEFAETLASVRRPGWASIADELNAEGFTRKNGERISADYARHVWFRARRARRGTTAAASASPPSQVRAASDSTLQSAPKPSALETKEDEDFPITTATPRNNAKEP